MIFLLQIWVSNRWDSRPCKTNFFLASAAWGVEVDIWDVNLTIFPYNAYVNHFVFSYDVLSPQMLNTRWYPTKIGTRVGEEIYIYILEYFCFKKGI